MSATTTDELTAFDALEELTQRGESELIEYRRKARARALEIGLPSSRDERWKYTPINKLGEIDLIPRHEPALTEEDVAPHRQPDTFELVFVNGVLREELSSGSADGIEIMPLDAVTLSREFRRGPEWHPFAAWNAATFREGRRIVVSANASSTPIHLLMIGTGGSDGSYAWSAPRVRIELERNASATLIESHVTSGSSAHLSAAVTEGFIGENARLEHIRVQDEGDDALHFGLTRFRQERSSTLTQFQFTLGARTSRYDSENILAGEGADLSMLGAYFLHDSQSGDHQTVIDHAVPHCTSREVYRGILDDASRGIFEGRIIVRPDAQKTSAEQSNDNLIISERAIANSTPQLEIYADDVKCRHGSTIGRLDDKALFYLRSRGIDEASARSILTMGFAGAVIEEIGYEPTRARLRRTFIERLKGRSA